MSPPRHIALEPIVERYCEPAAATLLAAEPFTIFHSWPGVLYALKRLEAAGGDSARLQALFIVAQREILGHRAACGAAAQLPGADDFCFGEAGTKWAYAVAADGTEPALAPPRVRVGYDSFANGALPYFAHCQGSSAAPCEAWASLIAAELAELTADIAGDRPILLGFAHGAAGVLFRALLLSALAPGALDGEALRRGLRWLARQAHCDGGQAVWPFRSSDAVNRAAPLSRSLCNGAIGHSLLFLEAAANLADGGYFALSRQALAAADEGLLPLGFCCGHAGKAALVSRYLRLGLRSTLGAAEGTLERLRDRIASTADSAPLSPIPGLASCLGAACAETPDSPLLDFFLPRPWRER